MLKGNTLNIKIIKFIGIFISLVFVELLILQFLAYIKFIKVENEHSLAHLMWQQILNVYKLSYINLPILLAVTSLFFKLFVIDNNQQYKRVFFFLLLWTLGFQGFFPAFPLFVLIIFFNVSISDIFLLISSPSDFPLGYLLFVYVFVLMGSIAAYYVFRKYLDKKAIDNFGYKSNTHIKDSIIGFLIGASFITVCFIFLYFIGSLYISSYNFNISEQLLYIIFFIIAAANEEIIFRGYVLDKLLEKGNKFVALFSSSVIFAIFHAMNPNITWLAFINLILAGMFLGSFYLYKRNLYLPTFLHFAWNYFQGPVYGFGVSGLKFNGILQHNFVEKTSILTGDGFGLEGSIVTTIIMILFTSGVVIFFSRNNKSRQNAT